MVKPIRVLHVFASLNRGGAETMLMNIYRAIDRQEVQFDFVVNTRAEEYAFEEEIKSLGGRIYYLPEFSIRNIFAYVKAWRKLISEHPEWKLVHGHHTVPGLIYIPVLKAMNRKTIAHSHTAGSDGKLKSGVKVWLRYPLRYMADFLFSCSELASKWMFGSKAKVTVVKNAIDTHKFSFNARIRTEKRIEIEAGDSEILMHVGRFEDEKNHLYLINLFREYADVSPNSKLVLIGDGRLKSEVEKKVSALGLNERVILLGVRPDVASWLQAADVFLFPSLYEGLGLVLIEAQANGLPCVVSDGVPQEVNVTGLVEFISLTAPFAEWCKKIKSSVKAGRDNESPEKIIKAGYDVSTNSKTLLDFYKEHG